MFMHRFWSIQELVEGTFEHLTPRELSRCARTSKHISEHALNRLYRHVNRLTDILKILGPLTVTMESHGLCKVSQFLFVYGVITAYALF